MPETDGRLAAANEADPRDLEPHERIRTRVLIAGAGVKGAGIARELVGNHPELSGGVLVVDRSKEGDGGMSYHNTGIAHSGIYYDPASPKAQDNREGFKLLKQFHTDHPALPYRESGKILVAHDQQQVGELHAKYHPRAIANGRPPNRVHILDQKELRQLEPSLNPNLQGGLLVEDVFQFDGGAVVQQLVKDARDGGAEVSYETKITSVEYGKDGGVRVEALRKDTRGEVRRVVIEADFLVNAAAMGSDRIAHPLGGMKNQFVMPVLGQYYDYVGEGHPTVNHAVYQQPKVGALPFLDPHAMMDIEGHHLHFGPTAMPTFGDRTQREHWPRDAFTSLEGWKDMLGAMTHPDTWRFYFEQNAKGEFENFTFGLREMYRHLMPGVFAREIRKQLMSPDFKWNHRTLKKGAAGLRAQVVGYNEKTGRMEMLNSEFGFEELAHPQSGDIVYIGDQNPGSPGFTAALHQARESAKLIATHLKLNA